MKQIKKETNNYLTNDILTITGATLNFDVELVSISQ